MALREIVSDLGADRGIILCEVGFQSGALEAARLTNIQPTSLADLSISARDSIFFAMLSELHVRAENCRVRYWRLSKDVRIAHGLRTGFSPPPVVAGDHLASLALELVAKAYSGQYPVYQETMTDISYLASSTMQLPQRYENAEEIVNVVDTMLSDLERRLASAEAAVTSCGPQF